MAKQRIFDLHVTKGSFQVAGIVSGTQKDNFFTEKKAKNGMINYGKTLLICSVLLISRFVHWNAVQVTLPTLK